MLYKLRLRLTRKKTSFTIITIFFNNSQTKNLISISSKVVTPPGELVSLLPLLKF